MQNKAAKTTGLTIKKRFIFPSQKVNFMTKLRSLQHEKSPIFSSLANNRA